MKKRVVSILLAVCIMLAMMLSVPITGQAVSSTDVPDGYTGIYTAEDLRNIENDLKGKYILMNDIDLSSTENWIPIEGFKGRLNGNGHSILNLTINSSDLKYIGLFSSCAGSISGLTITGNIYVKGVSLYVGSIAGATRSGEIYGCASYVSIVFTDESSENHLNTCYMGGIVGCAGGLIAGCSNWGTIQGNGYETFSYGQRIYLGGIAGQMREGQILNCFNKGQLSIIGHRESTNEHKDGHSGGIGGIVGDVEFSGDIETSYNIGKLKCSLYGENSVGSICATGIDIEDFKIKNCYYMETSSETHVPVAGEYKSAVITAFPLSEDDMKLQNSFGKFDFSMVWQMGNERYPYPIIQRAPLLDLSIDATILAPRLTLLTEEPIAQGGYFDISWTEVDGAKSYKIEVLDQSGKVEYIDSIAYAGQSYRISNLGVGKHIVRVSAISAQNVASNPSNSLEIIINPGYPQLIQKSGNFLHMSAISGKSESYPYEYDESWFLENSTIYNHNLAKMSLAMAMASFDTEEKVVGIDRANNITDLLYQLGYKFTNKSIHYETPTTDSIGYAIGHKIVTDGMDNYTIIAVAVRSGGYGQEWASNFTIGMGSVHAGFNQAADEVVAAVREYIQQIGASSNIKLWMSGYSRGAATTNIAAQRLDYLANSGQIKGLNRDNIFAYCFECPQTVQADSPTFKSDLTDNIFNIVNYVDLVTKVAPSSTNWNYTRFGRTLYLPSAEQTSEYMHLMLKMIECYSDLLENTDDKYPELSSAEYSKTAPAQGELSQNAVDTLAFILVNPQIYTSRYQDEVRNIIAAKFNGSKEPLANIVPLIFPALTGITEMGRQPLSVGRVILYISEIGRAHYPELCYSWLEALSADDLRFESGFAPARNREVILNAPAQPRQIKTRQASTDFPISVEVFDSANNLVAAMDESFENTVEDSTIASFIDENDQRILILPVDEEYRIQLTAENDSTISYLAKEKNLDSSSTEKIVSYYQVDLQDGDVLKGLAENAENSSADYPLFLNGSDTALAPSNNESGEFIEKFKVTVTKSGKGTATGGGIFSQGEYSKVSASPESGQEFLGWYQDGKRISTSAEYRFIVACEVQLEAKFTDKGNSAGPSNPTIIFYNIKTELNEHGTVIVKPSSIYKGGVVTVTANPDKGYKLEKISVIDSQGKSVEMAEKNGKLTFKMPARNVTVKASFAPIQTVTPTPTASPSPTPSASPSPKPSSDPSPSPWKNPFPDVPERQWFAEAVEYVCVNGVMTGYANGKFGPNDQITRAQFAQIFYNKEGRPSAPGSQFADVKFGQWYADAVNWAAKEGVVKGVGNSRFAPDESITREQIATMLWRYEGSPEPENDTLDFDDFDKVSNYALQAMLWTNENGIVNGKGNGVLDPRGKATRAETAQMLMNYLKK